MPKHMFAMALNAGGVAKKSANVSDQLGHELGARQTLPKLAMQEKASDRHIQAAAGNDA